MTHGARVELFDPILQNVAGLTLQRLADPLERFEAHAFHFAGFQQGYVLLRDANALSKLLRAHLALRQHDIEIDDDSHAASDDLAIVVGDLDARLEDVGKRNNEQRQHQEEEVVRIGPEVVARAIAQMLGQRIGDQRAADDVGYDRGHASPAAAPHLVDGCRAEDLTPEIVSEEPPDEHDDQPGNREIDKEDSERRHGAPRRQRRQADLEELAIVLRYTD